VITPEAAIARTGPWTHHNVSANGSRFHIVEMGSGPTVLLLHGFPSFWWTWREQLAPLAAAGFRAIAMDLRGYGGSDHPPQGYDPTTLARDCVSVIRSLGEVQASVVGHGVGSIIGWTMAAQNSDAVKALVSVAGAHPRVLRNSLLRNNEQRSGLSYITRLQLPFIPERYYTKNGGRHIGDFLEKYSYDPSWVTPRCAKPCKPHIKIGQRPTLQSNFTVGQSVLSTAPTADASKSQLKHPSVSRYSIFSASTIP